MSFSIAIDKDEHIYYPVDLWFTSNIYEGKVSLSELTENTYIPNHSLTLTLMSNNSVAEKSQKVPTWGIQLPLSPKREVPLKI